MSETKKHQCESSQMLELAEDGWHCSICGAPEVPGFDAAREASEAAQCPTCGGFGRYGDGPFSVGSECHDCEGRGFRPIQVTAPDFDAAREAYEAAQARLLGLIDNPLSGNSVAEYWAALKDAQKASNDAHEAMMEAWG